MPVLTMAQGILRRLPQAEQKSDASCYYWLICIDQYGDGWNNAEIHAYKASDKDTYWQCELTKGMLAIYREAYTARDTIQFYWNSGSYDNECLFFIADQNGGGLYTKPLNRLYADGELIYTMKTSPCSSSRTYNFNLQAELNTGYVNLKWNAISGASYYKVIVCTFDPNNHANGYQWAQACMNTDRIVDVTGGATNYAFYIEHSAVYEYMVLACNASGEVIAFEEVAYSYEIQPIGSIDLYFQPQEEVDFLTETGELWVQYTDNDKQYIKQAILQSDGWYKLSLTGITNGYINYRLLNAYSNKLDLDGTNIKYTMIHCMVGESGRCRIGPPSGSGVYTLYEYITSKGVTNMTAWSLGYHQYMFTWDPDPDATRYYLRVISKNPNPYTHTRDTVIDCYMQDGQQSISYPILRDDYYEWYVYSLDEDNKLLAKTKGTDFPAGGGDYTPQINYTLQGRQIVLSWSSPAPEALVWCYDETSGQWLYLEETSASGSVTLSFDDAAVLEIGIQSATRSSCLGKYIALSDYIMKMVDMSSLYCCLQYTQPENGSLYVDANNGCSYMKIDNTPVHFTATPDEHYYIYGWVVDGQLRYVKESEKERSSINLTMDRNHSVSVIIKEKKKYYVSATATPGFAANSYIEPARKNHYYYEGENIRVYTKRDDNSAAENYVFDYWGNAPKETKFSQSFYWTVDCSKVFIARWQYYRAPGKPKPSGGGDDPTPGGGGGQEGKTYTVTVRVEPAESGEAYSNKEVYAFDERASVFAEEINENYEFDHWKETGSGALQFDVNVRQNLVYTAIFKPKGDGGDGGNTGSGEKFSLSLKAGDGGTINDAAVKEYPANTEVEIIATPFEGYSFSHWSDKNGEIVDDLRAKDTITIYSDTTLIANFTDNYMYDEYYLNLSMTAGGMIVDIENIDGLHPAGDIVSLEAKPLEGYTFIGWSDGMKEPERTIIMDKDYSLIARFRQIQEYLFSFAANDPDYGYVEAYDDIDNDILETDIFLEEGTPISLYATPYYGYLFHSWRTNDYILAQSDELQFVLSQDTVITAYFNSEQMEEAIQNVKVSGLDVRVDGNMIYVYAPEETDFNVVSISGQVVGNAWNTNMASFYVPASGLYVVRSKLAAVKVVIR